MFRQVRSVLKIPVKLCSGQLGRNSPYAVEHQQNHLDFKATTSFQGTESPVGKNLQTGSQFVLNSDHKYCSPQLEQRPSLLEDIQENIELDSFFETVQEPSTKKVLTREATPRKIYSTLANSQAELKVVDYLMKNLEKLPADERKTICLFNPGFSNNLPEKSIETRLAHQLIIFDATKKSCDFWRRFKSNLTSIEGEERLLPKIHIEQFDFARIGNQALIDLKKSKPNTCLELLRASTSDFESPIRFVGVLPFFKERSFFLELLMNRLQNKNLFEFINVEFLLFISASKYMVLDKSCPVIYGQCKARRHAYSLFFDVILVGQFSFEDFNVKPDVDKAQYRKFLEKNGVRTDCAYLVHVKPKPMHLIGLNYTSKENTEVTRTNLHFLCFNRQLYLNSKRVSDFIGNFFAGSEEFLKAEISAQHALFRGTNFFERKSKSVTFEEELTLFNVLRCWSGYESSCFQTEADSFVDSSVYPATV